MDPERARGSRYEHVLLAADGFLFSAALGITASALLIGTMLLVFGSEEAIGEGLGAVAGQMLSLGAIALTILGGAILTWRLHGRRLDWGLAAAMLGGAAGGMAVAMPVFVGGAMLVSRIPVRDKDGPPWLGIGILAVLAAAVLAVPLVDAVRDASRRRREHLRLDWARLIAIAAVVLLAVVALPLLGAAQGSEVGEAGVFMVPFAAAGAFAVIGADILDGVRKRRVTRAAGAGAV